MIIHNKSNKWYVTRDSEKSSIFDSYEEMQRALVMCELPNFSNLKEIKSSKTHKRYVKA